MASSRESPTPEEAAVALAEAEGLPGRTGGHGRGESAAVLVILAVAGLVLPVVGR